MSKYKVNITGIDTSSLKVLSKSEMDKLMKRYKEGDKIAKEKIINGNLKLVLSIINKYNNGKNDMNDLFQIGCVGLIKAVDNFDESYGVMFSTYAVPLILGEVKRYIRDSTSIRVTRSVRDRAYQIMKFRDEYMTIHGIEPSINEILENLEITEYELANAMDSLKEPVSIYEPIYNDGGDTIYLLDQLSDKKEFDKCDDLISLRKALAKLRKREKDILIDRYIVGKTQMELASEMGVSQAQISRIEKNAINNVKKLIR
ncbi:MAG: sigma-70 family RNA polymerase sigma factor [Bacilli bacterium]|nr:sigma-70 family RNA polymerase sigma factor [Bacilli bacterium]